MNDKIAHYNNWIRQCSSMRDNRNANSGQISLPERLKRAEENASKINFANQQLYERLRSQAEQQRKKNQAAKEVADAKEARPESKSSSPEPSSKPPKAVPPPPTKTDDDLHCFSDLDTCMRSANTPGSCYFMYRKYEVTNTRLSSSLQSALQNCRAQCGNSRTSAGYCNSSSDFENLSLACDAEDRAVTGCVLH